MGVDNVTLIGVEEGVGWDILFSCDTEGGVGGITVMGFTSFEGVDLGGCSWIIDEIIKRGYLWFRF